EAYVNLGKALAEQGHVKEAIAYYRQAIALKPDHAQVRNNLGVALMSQGNLEQAIESFADALARMPGLAEAHNNLGIALFAMGRNDAALQSHRRALAAKPDFIEAYNNLARIYISERVPRSRRWTPQARARNPRGRRNQGAAGGVHEGRACHSKCKRISRACSSRASGALGQTERRRPAGGAVRCCKRRSRSRH